MRKQLTVACLGLAALLVIAGCGGSDHLSKPDFIAQGNAICKKGNDKINAAFKALDRNAPQAKFVQVTKQTAIPQIQGEIDGVDNLAAPKGDEDTVQKIVDDARAALDKVKADPAILGHSDPFKQANKEANAYGLKECGSG